MKLNTVLDTAYNRPPATRRGLALVVNGIEKQYGAIRALKGVSLVVEPGEVRGLVGENGAGKSTLGKIVAGVVAPDAGEIRIGGSPLRLRNAAHALAHGISIVAQELAVVPHMTVAENVMLGREPRRGVSVNQKELRARFSALSEQVGFSLDASARLGTLRRSEQQKVEILRAVARDSRLIVMDEPTAALSSDEARQLVAVVRRLAAEGRTIVFVSHHLDEVLAVCDNITVLRDGRYVRTGSSRDETPDSLVTSMMGHNFASEYPPRATPSRTGTPALRVSNLNSVAGLAGIDLEVWPGEVLGIAGLVGSGRSRLARAIFGADPHDGAIEIDGERVRIGSVRRAIDAGIAMLPESRKELGLMLNRSVTENISIPQLTRLARLSRVRKRQERDSVDAMLAKVGVRASAAHAPVGTLSGGTQQKVMFAKWLMTAPRIFIADEPSQGVDIGARARIYELIADMAQHGMAVLIISSQLEEVVGLANRVLVMRKGRIVGELADASVHADAILRHAFGTALAS